MFSAERQEGGVVMGMEEREGHRADMPLLSPLPSLLRPDKGEEDEDEDIFDEALGPPTLT